MIEFDPDKKARGGHGIDFDLAVELFDGEYIEQEDERFDYGETRLIVIGSIPSLGDGLYTAVYTWRGAKRRIISLRKSSDRESRNYRDSHA